MACEISSTEYGQCRCCLSKGNHRDINKEYCWESIREVYSDIFVECFNLCLSRVPNLTTLICSECITKLRNASSFKILVVNTENQLLEAVEHGNKSNIVITQDKNKEVIEDVKLENQSAVKVESRLLEDSDAYYSDDIDSNDDIFEDIRKDIMEDVKLKNQSAFKVESRLLGDSDDYYSDDIDSNDDIFEDRISPIVNYTNLVEGERSLLSRFPGRQLTPLPTRSSLNHICKNFASHLKALEGKVIRGKTMESLIDNEICKPKKLIKRNVSKSHFKLDQDKKKRTQRTKYREKELDIEKEKNPYTLERLSHATNISTILEFSNVTAFKSKHQRAYPCFYCEKLFEDFEDLRHHQISDHTKDNMTQCVLKKYRIGRPDGLVVYVDVTDLKCTVCDKTISNIKELKTHLTVNHEKKMFLDQSDRVIPFKVRENNFECQVCANLYETFGSIERHMNTHYRNYVCEECDSGFITKQRLRIHGYLMHSNRPEKFSCDICQKQFTTQQKRKIHVETVHENVKKYKCNRCPERFNEYFRRHKHMVLVHGVAPIEYKCNVCDKSFDRRYSLSTHMRTHIQQKDVYCEICPYRCFTKVELRHHMVKHNGERIYECSICKKSYAREKTLKEHMRIHTNDRRYVCPVCGMAFIQNCSLKSHIKSHHKEHGLL